ncbi:MAG TPA: K(+)-transporting ATPase subunit C, partial [Rhodoglobus sp.]|nr:K(+)-transporting ATPase subunit C [Rhodoglobus sp.]
MKQTWTALRALLIFTVVLGVGYPLLITGIGQLALPAQANGSLVSSDGAVVGSALIGQAFTDADGTALPEWFQSRPSAAGAGYDGGASSGSNYGPENPDLISAIQDRKSAIESLDSVTASEIPADALTASGSGLDPHISPAYALLQVPRVAEARGIPEA